MQFSLFSSDIYIPLIKDRGSVLFLFFYVTDCRVVNKQREIESELENIEAEANKVELRFICLSRKLKITLKIVFFRGL